MSTKCSYHVGDFIAIRSSLFGAAKLTKNGDPNKYSYFSYGIRFDAFVTFSLSNGEGFGKNFIIFGVENGCFAHLSIEKRYLILGKGPIDGLDKTTITTEAEQYINFSDQGKKLYLHYQKIYITIDISSYLYSNRYLFVNGAKIY